ncbi:MAG: hypothetical protein C4K49_01450 [Candidatus Thorarchaeota archaeon]|nr:MAG: hypothetical protein C4K49_01450 [Candidatus Thorarchaeota archaeon]
MQKVLKNPFVPAEIWDEEEVTVNEGDEEKKVDAKRYYVRYIVGESDETKFVDGGKDEAESVHEKTIYAAPSIHKLAGEPFHYDKNSVMTISGDGDPDDIKRLNRVDACSDHEKVEVAFESSGVECCAMSKEDADKKKIPVQYLAGYILGRSDGVFKVALSKTVLDDGTSYYENIHMIPEDVIRSWSCIE